MSRSYNTVHSGTFGELRQGGGSAGWRPRHTDGTQSVRVKTRQNRDGQQAGRDFPLPAASRAARIISTPPEACTLTRRTLGKFGGGGDGTGYRVRNVVEFQVEEDIKTKARELLNSARAFGGEKLAADFEHRGYAP